MLFVWSCTLPTGEDRVAFDRAVESREFFRTPTGFQSGRLLFAEAAFNVGPRRVANIGRVDKCRKHHGSIASIHIDHPA
jgi:hypothetical protein